MKRFLSTRAVLYLFGGLLVLLSIISTSVALHGFALKLNENQVLYLFSTSAQVIAGIYGLTLTGFIFFRNELTREALADETLTEAVEALKDRYFALLLFITALAGLTLLLSNLVISYEAVGAANGRNALFINVGQSAFVTTLLAIAYFVFDVIYPNRIEVESRRLQDKVDPADAEQRKGSLEEFVKNYNQIEALLIDAGQPYQEKVAVSNSRMPRRLSNARLAEILLRSERIRKDLFYRIRELITLRNSIIHGAEPAVSQELVTESAKVLIDLRAALASVVAES
ncbi:hypothetical protein D3C71_1326700 [compost metagenome]